MSAIIEKDWTTVVGLRAVCLICKRGDNRLTHRCGYVEVPKGHHLHGVHYHAVLNEIPKELAEGSYLGKKSPILAFTAGVGALEGETVRRSLDVVCDVHGGITYAGGKGYPVESDGWWFGFDCAHAGDGEIEPDPRWPRDGEVRSAEYVEAECESLAKQLKDLFP